MFARFFLVLAAFVIILFPQSSYAIDARCYPKSDCLQIRQEIGASAQEAADGFVQDAYTEKICGALVQRSPDESPEEVGFCLAAGTAKTTISFGGRNNFRDIADFMAFGYQYSIGIAVILAIVVIIIGGLQWAISAGNPGTIGSAKRKIFGAVAGLVIASTSFIILDTINPELTKLQPPNAYLIRSLQLTSDYCSLITDPQISFSPYKPIDPQVPPNRGDIQSAYNTALQQQSFTTKAPDTTCGTYYSISNNDNLVCKGLTCPENQTCHQLGNAQPQCRSGSLSGDIAWKGVSFSSDERNQRVIDSTIDLVAICSDGQTKPIQKVNSSFKDHTSHSNAESYIFPINTSLQSVCDTQENLLGFYLVGEINDSPGSDDFHAIGKNPSLTNDVVGVCNINLSRNAYQIINVPIDCSLDTDDVRCGSSGFSSLLSVGLSGSRDIDIMRVAPGVANDQGIGTAAQIASSRKEQVLSQIEPYLISLEELQSGFVCNIDINRDIFPDLD